MNMMIRIRMIGEISSPAEIRHERANRRQHRFGDAVQKLRDRRDELVAGCSRH